MFLKYWRSKQTKQMIAQTKRFFGNKIDNDEDFHNEHVYKVYDKIAEHFSATRYKPWPRVAHFLQHIKKGSIVLDIGCGNGRNMTVNPAIQMVGLDRCLPLLNIARERGEDRHLINADACRLPFRSESFDGAISIALIHHFRSLTMRQKIIKEIGRVLRKKSKALIYVRSLQILNNRNELVRQLLTQDFLNPWHLQRKYESNLQQAIERGYEYVAQKDSVIYNRFYHAFVEGQLQGLIQSCKQLQIESSFYDKSNWACIVSKL